MGNARLLRNFRFKVFRDPSLTKQLIACSEISGGFEIKNNYATYRPGNAPTAWPMQIVCGASASNVTFKYGMTSTENVELSDWALSATTTSISRFDWLIVVLFKDDGKPGAMWEIINAYPVSCKGPSLSANSAELAFEEIEVCHEGIRRVGAKSFWSVASGAAETILSRYASAISAVENAAEVAEFEKERAAKERAEAELAEKKLDALYKKYDEMLKSILEGKSEEEKTTFESALKGDRESYRKLSESDKKKFQELLGTAEKIGEAEEDYYKEKAEADVVTAAEKGAAEVLEEEVENLEKAAENVENFKNIIDADTDLKNERDKLEKRMGKE